MRAVCVCVTGLKAPSFCLWYLWRSTSVELKGDMNCSLDGSVGTIAEFYTKKHGNHKQLYNPIHVGRYIQINHGTISWILNRSVNRCVEDPLKLISFRYPKKVACPKNCPKINGYIITRITTPLKGLLGYDSIYTLVFGAHLIGLILGVGKLPYISRFRTA